MGLGRQGHGPFCAVGAGPARPALPPPPRIFPGAPQVPPSAPQPRPGASGWLLIAVLRSQAAAAASLASRAPDGRRGGSRRRWFWGMEVFLCLTRVLREPEISLSPAWPAAQPPRTVDSTFPGLRPRRSWGWRKMDGRALPHPSRGGEEGVRGLRSSPFLTTWGEGVFAIVL